jgi:hypothetical protein
MNEIGLMQFNSNFSREKVLQREKVFQIPRKMVRISFLQYTGLRKHLIRLTGK